MRKLIFAAMIAAVLAVLAGSPSTAWAGCGCGKTSCGCEQKKECGCKDKCGCEKKCSPCKSKCGCEKPKCESKCGCSKPKCGCGKPSCGCEKPKCGCQDKCGCNDCCAQKPAQNHHPYECYYRGSSMLCDMGCCAGPVCIPKCEVCTTTCEKHECKDECGCSHVSWESHTTCGVPERPRTIPWWFNIESGTGNIYPGEDGGMEGGSEEMGSAADLEEAAAEAVAAATKSETTESSEA